MFWNLFSKKKKSNEPPKKDMIGTVEGYYRVPKVVVFKLQKGSLNRGDKIRIKGHTTDYTFGIQSMQIEHKDIESAKKGDSIGVKTSKRARRGDSIYRSG
jgi:translation elongation factor EF-1alpha